MHLHIQRCHTLEKLDFPTLPTFRAAPDDHDSPAEVVHLDPPLEQQAYGSDYLQLDHGSAVGFDQGLVDTMPLGTPWDQNHLMHDFMPQTDLGLFDTSFLEDISQTRKYGFLWFMLEKTHEPIYTRTPATQEF